MTELRQAEAKLRPASSAEIIEALTPCLILVAPTGMNQADREDWLSAAGMTISEAGIPADLLKNACAAVRRSATVDHPAKIIAALMEELRTPMRWRRDSLQRAAENAAPPERRIDVQRCSAEDRAAIRKEFGLTSVFDEPAAPPPKPLPTVEDYMDHGLSRADAEFTVAQQKREFDARNESRRKELPA